MSANPLCRMSHLLKQLVIVGKFTKIHPEAQYSCWTELMCMEKSKKGKSEENLLRLGPKNERKVEH